MLSYFMVESYSHSLYAAGVQYLTIEDTCRAAGVQYLTIEDACRQTRSE